MGWEELLLVGGGGGGAAPTSHTQHWEALVHCPVVASEDSTLQIQCSETDLATQDTHGHIMSLLLNGWLGTGRLYRSVYCHLPGTSSPPFNCKVSPSPHRESYSHPSDLSPKISGSYPRAHLSTAGWEYADGISKLSTPCFVKSRREGWALKVPSLMKAKPLAKVGHPSSLPLPGSLTCSWVSNSWNPINNR